MLSSSAIAPLREGRMSGESCRVLVVDDNRDAADSTVMLLENWGHEAAAAYSAEQCIAVAKVFIPDVVLMDIGLPGKNGFDAKRELEKQCPAARFVALTGFTQGDIFRRSRDEGFVDHLVKPAAPSKLKDVVDHQCAIARSAP